MMPYVDHFYEPRTTVLEKNPQWYDSWPEDSDLDILPLDLELEGMDPSARAYFGGPGDDRRTSRELQSPDSQRRFTHSPINGPTAWSSPFPGHYRSSQPPYYEQYPRPSPPGLDIPGNGRQPRSWHGNTTELDASSTISPLSPGPQTPVAKSEVDFHVATSPWNAPPNTMAHQFEFKQEHIHLREGGPGVSLEQIHPNGRGTPMALRGVQGPPGPGHGSYPHPGHFSAELSPPTAADGFHYPPGYVSPRDVGPSQEESMVDEGDDEDDSMDAPGDDVSEYAPSNPTLKAQPARAPRGRVAKKENKNFLKPQNQNHRVNKHVQTSQLAGVATQFPALPSNPSSGGNICPHCRHSFGSLSGLQKHTQTKHTRPFSCIFRRYSCPQTFGSKNEWARHIRVQHLRLEGWRCDVGKCGTGGASSSDGGDHQHSFDRKDLFTQHLRRMHKELYTPKALAEHNGNKVPMESQVQSRCYVKLRDPPASGNCPYCSEDPTNPTNPTHHNHPSNTTQPSTTTGEASDKPETWEAFLEHVARHLEKGISAHDNDGLEDESLKHWLLDQDLLHPTNAWESSFKIVGADGKKSNTANRARSPPHPGPHSHPHHHSQGQGQTQTQAHGNVPPLTGHATRRGQRRSTRRNAVVEDIGGDLDAEGEDVD